MNSRPSCNQPPLGPRRLLVSGLALLLGLGALAGCGSSSPKGNGVAALSPTAIVAQTKAAADSARSVHIVGSGTSGGQSLTIDLSLAVGKGGVGTISTNGLLINLIEVNGTVYIKGSPAFYTHFAGPAAAQLLQGKWLEAPADNSNFSTLTSFTNIDKLFGAIFSNIGTLKKGSTATINGQQTVGVTDLAHGGTLYVDTTGTPYPVKIVNTTPGDSGSVSFKDWNKPVTLRAPANAVNLSQLQSGATG